MQKCRLFVFFSEKCICYYITNADFLKYDRRGGAVGYNVRIACERLGVRIPAATDLTGSDYSIAKHSATGISVTVIQRWPS